MNDTSSLAELVVAQHKRLKQKRHTELVQSILEGDTKHNVMLLLDGYDEYKKGTNAAIDNAIESTVGNCFLILTSRPGYVSEEVREKMEGEIIIEGFSKENISKYSTKYLESEDKSETMLKKAVQGGIRDLLNVPIILLLVCFLFEQNTSLPATQTKLFQAIFTMVVHRLVHRNPDGKFADQEYVDNLFLTLGRVSWEALQCTTGQLLLRKVRLRNCLSRDIMATMAKCI